MYVYIYMYVCMYVCMYVYGDAISKSCAYVLTLRQDLLVVSFARCKQMPTCSARLHTKKNLSESLWACALLKYKYACVQSYMHAYRIYVRFMHTHVHTYVHTCTIIHAYILVFVFMFVCLFTDIRSYGFSPDPTHAKHSI